MDQKILIIDDSEQDRKIMGRILTQNGYTDILYAENGEEGIQLANEQDPFIVIIDTILPEKDGFEICKELKNNPKLKCKAILLTGHVDAIDSEKADEVQADNYIVKTSDYSMLCQAIEKHIDDSHNVF